MSSKKIRRKSKKKKAGAGGLPVRLTVRLRREEAMELQRLAHGAGLGEAERHLAMMRPDLDKDVVHEVAWRCEDPLERGGIVTGSDADGDYVDIAVTE